jgi:hypothetical protein
MSALPELKVAKVIQACGKIDGRVKLQKVVYLLSAMGYQLPYRDFHVRHYGPFSPCLAAALDFLVEAGVVDEQAVEVGSEYPRFDYTPTSRYSELLSNYVDVATPTGCPGVGELAPRLAKRDRAVLEIAATMQYLHSTEDLRGDDLLQELRVLKGQLPEFEAKLAEATGLLGQLGLPVGPEVPGPQDTTARGLP